MSDMKPGLSIAERLEKLPEVCASRLPSTGEPILIERGASGYYAGTFNSDPDKFNREWEVTPAQVQAMEAGSMFGWHVPGANPDKYPDADEYHYNKRTRNVRSN